MSPTAIATKKKTATAAASSSKTSAPADLEQLELENMRNDLAAYRDFVGMAADGQQLNSADMGQVSGVMSMLEIPKHAWKRDIDAERRMRDFNRHLDGLLAEQAEREVEVQQLDGEIRQAERRLAEAKARRHQHTVVTPNTIAGYSQRIGQLRSEHPHLFHGLDDVVRHRLAEKARKAAAAPRIGWGA